MSIYIYILAMALTTYLIRALPLILLKKPIRNRFIKSFLHYIPAASLAAMTFPAILFTTQNIISAVVGLAVAIGLALWNKGLVIVAVASCAAVFLTDFLLHL